MNVSPRAYNNREYDSEKDVLISSLRKQVFDLEQNEKNYNVLNNKYKNLQNDYTIICESKLKQEYEYKQRLESANKELSDLRGEIDSIQNTLDDRISLNKKLYQDNSALHKLSEDRAMEIGDLKNQLMEARMNIENLSAARANLEKNMSQANNEIVSQKELNDKLIDDNEKLAKIVEEQDENIRALETDKRKLNNRIDELNFENKSILGKLKSREDALNDSNKKIEEVTRSYTQLENKYSDLDAAHERTKLDLSTARKDLGKEKNVRLDCERAIDKLEGNIREKEKDIRNATIDIENLKILNSKLTDEKNRQQAEIDRLKSHIMVLTEQNQKYVEEIESTIEQDEKLRQQLAMRRDQNDNLLKNNKAVLERSLNNLDDFLNSKSTRMGSPTKYSATRYSNN